MTAEITPFTIAVPEADIDDLKARLSNVRWPDELPGVGWAYGLPLGYAKELSAYWRDAFDWRAAEARINRFPQFTTVIDGQKVHLLHVKSGEPNAISLMMIHGWPGSVVEFLGVIDSLTKPEAHGGAAGDAFDLVIPSIPGFGFSGPTTETGWHPERIAWAFLELMTRLGYERFGVQGGDLGAWIGPLMGKLAPERLIGVHVNAATVGFMPMSDLSQEDQASLTEAEKRRLAMMQNFRSEEWGYNAIQSTRPQTLAYGLTDSAVGQMAWIMEKFKSWTSGVGLPEESIDRDWLLTNLSVYWFTGTANSASRVYYESGHSNVWGLFFRPSPTPVGVAVFSEDVAIRRFSEGTNHIVRWTEFNEGGHFAAMEVPDLLAGDVREFFRQLR